MKERLSYAHNYVDEFLVCISWQILLFLSLSGIYTPFVFVYEKAISEVGVSKSKASLILSLLGINVKKL